MLIASACVLAGVQASTAAAGTVKVSGGSGNEIRFDAAPGETNTVTVTVSAIDTNQYGNYARATFTDTTAALVAVEGCQSVDVHTATCLADAYGFTLAQVLLGDGDDSATLGPLNFGYVEGNEGNDVLTGSDGGIDRLWGGSGNDTLSGRGGDDRIDAPTEISSVVDQGGSDTYNGGAGSDVVSYATRTNAVSATQDGVANDGELGEHDNVAADVEAIVGGAADDFLVGTSGVNDLEGGAGNDRILGLGGNDTVEGGFGADRIDAGAGNDLIDGDYSSLGADDVHGGAGVDTFLGTESGATITLDDGANDGAAAQNIHSDVENVTVYSPASVWGSAAANDLRESKPYFENCNYTGSVPGVEIHGRAGNDTLTTYNFDDRLYGDDGADTMYGGCGADYMSGGTGQDSINARDGVAQDVVSCGAGVDRVTADPGDSVAKDCELVNRTRFSV